MEPKVVLTARERQVLEHMGRGLRNADIANALDISIKTVEAHIRQIFLKLSAQNRTQAVLNAQERGFLNTKP